MKRIAPVLCSVNAKINGWSRINEGMLIGAASPINPPETEAAVAPSSSILKKLL